MGLGRLQWMGGRAAARRLNRLVGNLLDQTRLETGALKPHLDWCDVHYLVNAAIDAGASGVFFSVITGHCDAISALSSMKAF